MISHNEKETIDLGARLAKYLKRGDIVCLFGELGSGKTTLVKGLAQGLNVRPDKVNSPTFILMNVYQGKVPVYHFDLYRIDGQGLAGIGYEEFFYDEGVSVVEWAERLGEQMPKEYVAVRLLHKNENTRLIKISARGKDINRRLGKLKL